ncbi:putative quinol monooxygenase [Cyclobacterium jeungdonense]|uniref:Antibiotic biosynthesis monooxygenase n=1 Tax=Cyclobacterium jeungdonense TaxID=708087 RepID=A0ABT8C709_9BACT|nr:hypothetical protein [Cyclobacterium jeungdonense]MDN3688555.1 hypothetical protein [Cyclobacterium jeungdonense]
MSNLQISARFQIHNGKLEAFKKLAKECLSVVKTKDKDTLQYDWYFDKEQTECVLRETYPDSNALLAHLGNLGDLFGKILSLGEFSAEVYGQPSEELLNATSGLKIKIYTFYQGL